VAGPTDGIGLAAAGAGALFLYAGIRGYSVPHALQSLITGKAPSAGGQAYPVGTPTAAPAGAGSAGAGARGGTATGNSIASDFLTYAGKVPYVWGGASPVTGWDCSGSCNYVINRDNNTAIPGAGPGQLTGHGPSTLGWLAWAPGHMIRLTAAQAGVGDLVIWQTHMGVITGPGEYVSAYDTQEGTVVKPIHGGGPAGEIATFWRLK
jgi:cell wall-associated NlpC family hydrolase